MISGTTEEHIPLFNTNLTETMDKASKLMLTSVQRNFGEGGRPKWKDLKKGGQSFLYQKGNLLRGIHREFDATSATVSTSPWVGNRIHQFGGWAGRNHASFIPARPYMMFQEEDVKKLNEMVIHGIFTSPERSEDAWIENQRRAGMIDLQ